MGRWGLKYGQITCWEKKIIEWAGEEKRGENAYFFPQFPISMHIFPNIDLTYTKLKIMADNAYGVQPPIIKNVLTGKNINLEMGGGVKI